MANCVPSPIGEITESPVRRSLKDLVKSSAGSTDAANNGPKLYNTREMLETALLLRVLIEIPRG